MKSFIITALLASTSAFAQTPAPTSFLSFKLGAPIAESLVACPTLPSGTPNVQARDTDDHLLACSVKASDHLYVAANIWRRIPFQAATIGTASDNVSLVSVEFPVASADYWAKALVTRYGSPTSEKIVDATTNDGVLVHRHIMEWIWPSVTVRYESTGNNAMTGTIHAVTPAYLAQMHADENKQTAEAASKF